MSAHYLLIGICLLGQKRIQVLAPGGLQMPAAAAN
jgi:hypothetical protein